MIFTLRSVVISYRIAPSHVHQHVLQHPIRILHHVTFSTDTYIYAYILPLTSTSTTNSFFKVRTYGVTDWHNKQTETENLKTLKA